MSKEYTTIYTAKMARKLLRMGFEIKDIKPDKYQPERSLFIFKNCVQLQYVLQNLK